ncbi:hypothetical protein [Pigmentiphaga soli]
MTGHARRASGNAGHPASNGRSAAAICAGGVPIFLPTGTHS